MADPSLAQALQIAIEHHQAGRLSQAESIYRHILARQSDHADALHLLGVMASQLKHHDIAIDLIRRAIAIRPHAPDYHSNLGIALNETGRLDEAIVACRRAIALRPDFAAAHRNLGSALKDKGELDEAIACYQSAAALRPESAEAHNNLGNVLKDKGRLDEAIACYQRALALQPDYAIAHSNLGNALKDKGRLDDAIAACQRAIALKPDFAEAHNTLGLALKDKGRLVEAIAACQRAIALDPRLAPAHTNLGMMFQDASRLDEAIAACRQAIELKPDFVEAHNNLGNVLKDAGQLHEAIACYQRALAQKPDYVLAHSNLLMALHYPSDDGPAAIFEETQRRRLRHAAPLEEQVCTHPNDRSPDRRLRIGYVSPDFRTHPVGFFIEGLLACHDPRQVEVFCYSQLPQPDAVTARLRQHAAQRRDIVGLTDAQTADLIRQDRIDILVDLAGHTAHHRLLVFARKPASVQVTYLGYPNTTGLKRMDYRLTDAAADPVGPSEALHTEQLVPLPRTAWCFRPPDGCPEVTPPPAQARGHITFGSFNNLSKISGRTLALWADVLRAVPKARLALKALALSDPTARKRLRQAFAREGIEQDRLELLPPVVGMAEHLGTYQCIDIALDTFPYHGTTTTCEAMYMGVAVVTLAGRAHVSRVGASLLTSAGLANLIAQTPDEYVRIAAGLAGDLPRLAEMRSTLRQRMAVSPLMDAPQFARDVEDAYRKMWRKWCSDQSATPT